VVGKKVNVRAIFDLGPLNSNGKPLESKVIEMQL